MKTMLPVAILCGGLGTRLGGFTRGGPKALVDVNGEPFVAHQLRLLARQNVKRVVLCTGYLGRDIAAYVGNGASFGLDVEYSHDGPRQLGTAGALLKAAPQLGDDFFVMYGDSYLPGCDFAAVQARYESEDCLGLLTVCAPPERYRPNVQLTDSRRDSRGERVAIYSCKAAPWMMLEHIDYGLSVLDHRALTLAEKSPDLGDVLQQLATLCELAGYLVNDRFYEIGSLAGLVETRRFVAAQLAVR